MNILGVHEQAILAHVAALPEDRAQCFIFDLALSLGVVSDLEAGPEPDPEPEPIPRPTPFLKTFSQFAPYPATRRPLDPPARRANR